MCNYIKVIIVDDESLVRKRFRYGFSLEEHGFKIVGEAEDGIEALALCEQLKPDIVITDIVMPRMDGLELTRNLKSKLPNTKIIILSNHQEFEFARKAVTYGAMGYMLKVTSGYRELLELLEQARKEIEAEREAMAKDMRNRYQIQQSKPWLCKTFILDLLKVRYKSFNEIHKQCQLLEINKPSYGFTMVFIYMDNFEKIRTVFPKDLPTLTYSLVKMVEEISEKSFKSIIFLWPENSIRMMIHWNSHEQMHYADKILMPLLKEISYSVDRYLPFTASIITSNHKRILDVEQLSTSINESFLEVNHALQARFYAGHRYIHMYKKSDPVFKPMDESAKVYLKNQVKSINPSLEIEALEKEVEQNVTAIIREMRYDPQQIIMWLQEFTLEKTKHDPRKYNQMLNQLQIIETTSEFTHYLMRLITWNKEKAFLEHEEANYREEILKALEYIGNHYHEPLNVTDVCHHIDMSPNYFSHLFHTQTGMKFTAYVTQFRVQQAQKLLLETSLQVQEIAEKVGIPDYKYFVRLFRRATGQTPSQYRTAHF